MLEQLSKHGGMALEVSAKGDLKVDAHHTVENVGIAVGEALKQALSDKTGLARYGHAVVPLDEALVEAVVDLSGRPHLTWNANLPSGKKFIGAYDVDLTRDFFQALVNHAALCLHVNVRYGRNLHHIVEAIFKATARASGPRPRSRAAGCPRRRACSDDPSTSHALRARYAQGRRTPAMIALVDYGAGNLRSVENALRAVGADVRVTHDPDAVRRAERIVVPGQGSMK